MNKILYSFVKEVVNILKRKTKNNIVSVIISGMLCVAPVNHSLLPKDILNEMKEEPLAFTLQNNSDIADAKRFVENVNEQKEKERIAKKEQKRLEKERLERQRLEKERQEKERLEKERLEKERLEQERLEKQKTQKEKQKKGKTATASIAKTKSSGSSNHNASSSNSGTSDGKYKITAYCACSKCCGKSNGITASGAKAKEGVTVATGKLKFGTKVYIEGVGNRVVQDRGVNSKTIDVYFTNHSKALQFGVKYKNVKVVK